MTPLLLLPISRSRAVGATMTGRIGAQSWVPVDRSFIDRLPARGSPVNRAVSRLPAAQQPRRPSPLQMITRGAQAGTDDLHRDAGGLGDPSHAGVGPPALAGDWDGNSQSIRTADMRGVTMPSARKEVAQHLNKPLRLVQVREMSRTHKELYAAPGERLVSGGRVPGGNHPIPRAPDNQGGDPGDRRQMVMRSDRLSARVDDGASGGKKGASAVSVGEGREPAPDLGHIRSGPPARPGKGASHRFGPDSHPMGCDQRQDPFRESTFSAVGSVLVEMSGASPRSATCGMQVMASRWYSR